MFQADKKPILFNKELSGGVVTFNSRLKNMPLSKCKITIPISQQGSGTPAPDNIREFIGVSGVNIGQTSGYGEYFRGLLNGTYGFVDLGSLTWYLGSQGYWYCEPDNLKSATLSYIYSNTLWTVKPKNVSWADMTNGQVGVGGVQFRVKDTNYSTASDFRNSVSGVYLIYELATPVTPTITPEQFATLCQAFGITGNTYQISFGQTVYGGELDVLTGIFTVTTIFYKPTSAYNVGESGGVTFFRVSIPKPGVGSGVGGRVFCNVLKQNQQQYSLNSCRISTGGVILQIVIDQTITSVEGATQWLIDNDCTFVYELAEPIEVILDGHTIEAVKGANNIFANIGTTTVGYVEVK